MRYAKLGVAVVLAILVIGAAAVASAQGTSQVYNATAAVKTASGAAATAPVTITITRMMSKDEADKLATAFKTGGAEALKKALVGVKPTGTVVLGKGKPTPLRIAFERALGNGHLITLVTDRPLLFLGAGVPGAKPTTGHDFGVIDLQVDAAGSGSGQISPAASVKVDENGAFVVQDYSGELIKLNDVKKSS